MKSKDLQPRLLHPAKLSFRMQGHIKNFAGKKKLKEFITTKPVLHEMLMDFPLEEEEKRIKNEPKNGNKTYQQNKVNK